MDESPRGVRREVHYSGRVQGVGFRYTAQQTARKFRVTGFARNLPDGRVHLVAEGEQAEIDRFLGAIAAALGGNIRGTDTNSSLATGEFSSFAIRH